MIALAALLLGLLFGLGLIVGGMTDPAKVLAFLDLGGAWDPSLALVMGGAVVVATGLYALARRRGRSVLGGPLHWPTARAIDGRLIGGSLLFGVGWGLAGFCPGPALVALGAGQGGAAVFVGAMLAGMALFEAIERVRRPAPTADAEAAAPGAGR